MAKQKKLGSSDRRARKQKKLESSPLQRGLQSADQPDEPEPASDLDIPPESSPPLQRGIHSASPKATPEDSTITLEGEPALEEDEEAEGEAPEAAEEKQMRRGMSRSRRLLNRPFSKASTRKAIGPEFWEEAEEALIAADAGVTCASELVERARKRILSERIRDIEGLKEAFRVEVADMLRSFGTPTEMPPERPHVLFVVGVNGVGKTTTCAKIGYRMKASGLKVIYAAADTFRAAGIEQMEVWARRVGAPVVRHKTGGDPAAVVFDAIESATAREMDVVVVDTAGRLHTKKNLMDELNKMWRVAERQLPGEPEALLVIDATTGQNGVTQARVFGEALPLSSIALTKMDGSAKGGVVLAIGRELGIPVAYVGVGEGMTDLRPFDPDEYASALF